MELVTYKTSKRHLKNVSYDNFIQIIKDNNYEKDKILK